MARLLVNGVRRDSRSGAVPAARIDLAPTRPQLRLPSVLCTATA